MLKTILWDFDGVILDSMNLRSWGFREIFKNFDAKKVDQLIDYHNSNGGLSRYVKIRYFFEVIHGVGIKDEEIITYAEEFSQLMRKELINTERLIVPVLDFIRMNFSKYDFHIVSGSDQEELRYLCQKLGIAKYFISINGSPIHKNELVENVLSFYNCNNSSTCLIGDSINDYTASKKNNILFLAYNNDSLSKYNDLLPLF